MDNVGEFLKVLRKKHKYSQQYLADYLGVIRQTYSHYETGRIVPTYKTLVKLAELYQISPDTLMGMSGIEEQSLEEKILIQYYREMDARDKEELVEIAKRKAERNVDNIGKERTEKIC